MTVAGVICRPRISQFCDEMIWLAPRVVPPVSRRGRAGFPESAVV